MDAGETVRKYDFQECAAPFMKTTMEHLLMSAHLTTATTVEKLSVSCVSEKDSSGHIKLPIVLQVRANESFKKGRLMLFPSGADVLVAGGDTDNKVSKTQGTVHESMLSSVQVHITSGPPPAEEAAYFRGGFQPRGGTRVHREV